MCLLEVVPENLLVLDRALAVHVVGPFHEALVERRARSLEDPLVRRVANQDVVEAERLFLGRSRPVRVDELLVGQRMELGADRGLHALRGQVLDGVPDEDVADHGGGLDDRPLLGLEVVEPRRKQCLDRGRHRHAVDRADGTPAAVLEANDALVDEHGQELLDEERIPLRGLDDPGTHLVLEPGLPEQMARDLPRMIVRERPELDPPGGRRRRPLG